jgi:hypothetical protein
MLIYHHWFIHPKLCYELHSFSSTVSSACPPGFFTSFSRGALFWKNRIPGPPVFWRLFVFHTKIPITETPDRYIL